MFNTYHLSHLLVVNQSDFALAGIITRKDLDAYMHYEQNKSY